MTRIGGLCTGPGLTDEEIDRSVFTPEMLEMVNANISKDPTLQVLMEKRLTGRLNSIAGKKFAEITEVVRGQERDVADRRGFDPRGE